MNKPELLTSDNCQIIFIDRQVLNNNTVALAKAARILSIPTTITTVESDSFSGHT